MEPGYAARTATESIGQRHLRGLWQHAPYFPMAARPTSSRWSNHYNQLFALNLTTAQKADLVEFLKSI